MERHDQLKRALVLLEEAIRHLDDAGAPAQIAARVDHAVHELAEIVNACPADERDRCTATLN